MKTDKAGVIYNINIDIDSKEIKNQLSSAKKYPISINFVGRSADDSSEYLYDNSKEFEQNKAYLYLSYIDKLVVDTLLFIVSNTAVAVTIGLALPFYTIFQMTQKPGDKYHGFPFLP